jgi:uncharacterized delta-60 repeat protein
MRYYLFKSKILCLLFFFGYMSTNQIHAAPIYFDASFGTNGIVTTTLGDSFQINGSALQTDGKIIVVGNAIISGVSKMVIARYTTTGLLDTTFGSGGMVIVAIGSFVSANSVAIQTDGKILVTGYSDATSATQMFVTRYSSSGILDTGFGTSGITHITIGDGSVARSVIVQTDGYIVISGAAVLSGQPVFAVARCDTSGALDTGFNSTGIVTTIIGSAAQAYSVKIQADGKIVVGGISDNHFAVARYTTAGLLDTASFGGGNGYVITVIGSNDGILTLLKQSDEKLVGVGFSDNAIALARYDSSGNLDSSFGSSGIVTTFVGSQATAFSSALQSDGKIVISGTSDNAYLVGRYTTAGALDSTFGFSGIITTALGDVAQALSVLVQTDGKIVASGLSDANGVLARYVANNTPFITISSPSNGSTITSGHTSSILGGSSDTAGTVGVTVNGVLFTTVSTDSNGNWNAGTSPLLNDGSNTINVTLTVGGVQVASASSTFTVSAAHTITITNPANASTQTTSSVTVTGTSSKASATVNVDIDGASFTPVTTDASGNWNAGLSANLVNGTHTVNAVLKNGATTLASTSNTFTTNAPDKITISVPAVGSSVGLTTPINGTSTRASSTVQVFINGAYFKSITSDGAGGWDAGTSLALNIGSNAVNAHIINSSGNVLAHAINNFTH